MNELAPDWTDAFWRDGFAFPLTAMTPDEAADLRGGIERHEAARAGRLPPAFNMKAHLLLPALWQLVHDRRITDPVAQLLGPDVLCFGTSFISKGGSDDRYVSWHQDATHWGLSSPLAVTAWVALTDSCRDNGCVRVMPGTHGKVLAHANSDDADNMLGRREYVVDDVDADRAVDLELEPGQMSLHHALVVHGSDPNRSGRRRLGFAIRYLPGTVRQTDGRRNFATLVRGTDHGTFDLEQAPEGDFHPAALARHREVLRRGMAVIYDGKPAGGGPAS